MPELKDALDLNRYAELVRQSDLGENLWASLRLASERGDAAAITYHCKQIAIVTKATFALVKLLGVEVGDNG